MSVNKYELPEDKIAARNALVLKHAHMVKSIAMRIKARLPAHVDIDDLIQAGMLGLMNAATRFQDGQGATFATYAGIRINGEIIDHLRAMDWTPRSVHQQCREMAESMSKLRGELLREPSDKEVAEDMGVSMDEYYDILSNSNRANLIGLEGMGIPESIFVTPDFDPDNDVNYHNKLNMEFKKDLIEAIKKLPEREKLCLSLFYKDGLNGVEIGKIMGVGSARVSQILGRAYVQLNALLSEWTRDENAPVEEKPKRGRRPNKSKENNE